MSFFKNIIITATNDPYYDSLLTLISSIHKHSFKHVDQIFVYNLGLTDNQINKLKTIKYLTVVDFSDKDKNSHPKFMEPKSYVYKIHCMHDAKKFGSNILWIDSGAMFLKSNKEIFDYIEQNGLFLVGDIHKNISYTHSDCRKIMEASDSELNDNQIWAGLVGYNINHQYANIIKEAYEYSMIPGCLDGNQENHRHDQSILSILASRYNIVKQNIDKYGYWTDSTRNMTSAVENDSVVFAHRRGYINYNDIIYND